MESIPGPNAAGKTATISMISGLLEPSRGDARIGGFSIVNQLLQAKKLLGVVPPEAAPQRGRGSNLPPHQILLTPPTFRTMMTPGRYRYRYR